MLNVRRKIAEINSASLCSCNTSDVSLYVYLLLNIDEICTSDHESSTGLCCEVLNDAKRN